MEPKTVESALASLKRTCARMERCRSDVRQSLYRFGIEKSLWDGIIESLEKERFIDEKRYADSFVREKSSLQKWSRKRIISGLRAKGIAEEHISSALENCISEDKNLDDVLTEKRKKIKDTDLYVVRRKLFAYGVSKGFDIDDINDYLNENVKID